MPDNKFSESHHPLVFAVTECDWPCASQTDWRFNIPGWTQSLNSAEKELALREEPEFRDITAVCAHQMHPEPNVWHFLVRHIWCWRGISWHEDWSCRKCVWLDTNQRKKQRTVWYCMREALAHCSIPCMSSNERLDLDMKMSGLNEQQTLQAFSINELTSSRQPSECEN